MLRKLGLGLAALVALLLISVFGFLGYQAHQFGRQRQPPHLGISADTSPAAVARGEHLFEGICAECHVPADATTTRGNPLRELPAFLGVMNAANITADRTAGVGGWSDEQLAVLIKAGIGPDGRARAMFTFPEMADADLSALLGYLRSGRGAVAPDPTVAPRSELSFVGRALAVMFFLPSRTPLPGVKAPAASPSAEYGRYLSTGLFHCYGCHTGGFSQHKLEEPGLFGGGGRFSSASGETYYSPNITFDPAGIAGYSLEDFKRALRDGVDRHGGILRPPMPRLRAADEVELAALYAYLQSVPRVSTPTRPGTAERPHAVAGASPEQAFAALGCVSCHGPKAPYRDRLQHALGKSAEDVARWIRNPESFKPGTQMPTFAALLPEPDALALARWIQVRQGQP